MPERMRHLTAILCLTAALAAGCSNSQPYVTSERLERGLVLVLTGIEGRSHLNESICRGLDAGGVDYAIQLEDWTAPVGPVLNQRNETRNRERARELAKQIAGYQRAYPHRPVVLVGQSGGGAIATWIAEYLPGGGQLDGVILLAASLSPGYALDRALLSSRKGIVNFHSSRDWVLLGLGTTTIGTMDSVHTVSAGSKGFDVPEHEGRQRLYERLFQIPWSQDMADTGNIGTHLTSGDAKFVAIYVAPLVRAPQWNALTMDRVLKRQLVEPRLILPDVKPEPGQYGLIGR